MGGVISELSPPKTDASFGVSINHLCEVECAAIIFSTRSPEPSAAKRAAQSRTGKNENEMEVFFSAFHPPGSHPPPQFRPSEWSVIFRSNMFRCIRCRSRLARRIPSDESFFPIGMHVHSLPFSYHTHRPGAEMFSCVSGPRCIPRAGRGIRSLT